MFILFIVIECTPEEKINCYQSVYCVCAMTILFPILSWLMLRSVKHFDWIFFLFFFFVHRNKSFPRMNDEVYMYIENIIYWRAGTPIQFFFIAQWLNINIHRGLTTATEWWIADDIFVYKSKSEILIFLSSFFSFFFHLEMSIDDFARYYSLYDF